MLQGREYPREEFESLYSEVGFGGLNYVAGDRIDPKWGRSLRFGSIPACDELNPVTQSGNMKMVRRGEWKLIFDMMGGGRLHGSVASGNRNLPPIPAHYAWITRQPER